jgi:signal transduction histidine kinase
MRPLLDTVFDALAGVLDYTAIAVLTLDETRERLMLAQVRGPEPHTSLELQHTRYAIADLGAAWDRLAHDEPIVIADVRTQPGETEAGLFSDVSDGHVVAVRSLLWVPLTVRQEIIGVLAIANAAPGAFDARDATLALGIARQAAVAIDNARLQERARHAAVLEERQRLARELHDSVTQALYGISLYAEAADRALIDGDVEPAATNLRELRETSREALGEMRLLIYELRPPLLEEYGLAAALRARLKAVETRAGLVTDFVGEEDERLTPEAEQELYRLAQEALNNVLKHAHAQHVRVRLEIAPTAAVLEIADDGVGFESAFHGREGFGLPGMRERAQRLGGDLRVESSPGAGTRIEVTVPR